MHSHGFFHRNLEPENILLKGSVLKIADFSAVKETSAKPPFTEYLTTRQCNYFLISFFNFVKIVKIVKNKATALRKLSSREWISTLPR